MKKLTSILLLLASFVTSYSKQSYEVVTSGGYLLNDKIHFSEGVLDFKNSASMGLAFIARYDDSKEFELDYSFAPQTKVHFQSFKPFLYNEFDTKINIHQVHINLLSYLTKKTLIQPFYSSGVGVAIFDVLEGGAGSHTKISINLGFGGKYHLSDRIAVRMQARFISPITFEGVGIYGGIGTGVSGGGLSLYAPSVFIQGEFRAGLIFKLGKIISKNTGKE